MPQRLDITLAYKALSLTPELSGTEKRVAGAILDCFNKKTGQCDPGFGRIGHLLLISRRTVIRAVSKIEGCQFFRKRRHGGHLHRNSYEPNWPRFREIEAQWAARKKTRHWQTSSTDPSPCGTQTCHLGGDEAGTQTNKRNQFNQTKVGRPTGKGHDSRHEAADGNPNDRRRYSPLRRYGHAGGYHNTTSGLQSARAAARVAAARRWNTDLLTRYRTSPDIFSLIVDAIDVELQEAATNAEMSCPGEGAVHITQELARRGISL